MNAFNVIIENNGKFVSYDIMPYLYETYKKASPKPKTTEEFKDFIKRNAMYQWWSRCEYEIVISDWPPSGKEEKWDVYKQVMMNIDVITHILEKEVIKNKNKK